MTKLKDILDTYDNTLAIASQISETSVVTRRKAFEKCRTQFEAAINEYIAEIIGEDDVQAWDDVESFCVRCGFQPTDDTRQCICTQRNKLRHVQHYRAGITGSGK